MTVFTAAADAVLFALDTAPANVTLVRIAPEHTTAEAVREQAK